MGTAVRKIQLGTAIKLFRIGSSGALLVPRSGGTTASPMTAVQFGTVQNTGGFYAAPDPIVVSPEEQEWASLLEAERQSLAKRRIKVAAVDKVMKQVRYAK